jgi:MFS transporter, PPP family, 3-phenylpropionic acid transporter
MSSRSFSLRLSIFNAFLFLGSGIQLPFMPLWLQGKGLTAAQIALVMALMTAVRILAVPLGTYFTDVYGNRRRIIIIAAFSTFAAYLLLHFMSGFMPILIVALIAGGMLAPVGPLVEVMAIEGSAYYGIDYGRIRLWASLSFLAGSLISGALLEVMPVGSVVLLIAAAQGIGALGTLVLPTDKVFRKGSSEPFRMGAVLTFITGSIFIIFMAASSIGQSSHGLLYAFGSVHFDSLGYSKLAIGELWAIGVVTEIVMFAFSNRFYKAFGAVKLIVIGTACGVIRWVVIGLEPPLVILFLVQMLHAGSFGLTHLGTMHYIRENVPDGMRNTVQGLYSALSGGILLSSTMWASGPLYGLLGGQAYFVMALYSAMAFGLALILNRVNPRAR